MLNSNKKMSVKFTHAHCAPWPLHQQMHKANIALLDFTILNWKTVKGGEPVARLKGNITLMECRKITA